MGESGCGKSVTSFSVMRLVGAPGRIVEGEVLFDGRDLLDLPESEMKHIRGNRISMIFQQPMSCLTQQDGYVHHPHHDIPASPSRR